MKLAARIAATMALLVAVTAAAVATAGIGVTRDRLNAEIDASIAVVASPVTARLVEAKATCGLSLSSDDGDGDAIGPDSRGRSRRDGGGPGRQTPRELVVQCLDRSGKVMATSPSMLIPISDDDAALASGATTGRRVSEVVVDGERSRVVTVGIETFGAVQIARSVAERDRVVASLLRRVALIAGIATALAVGAGLILAQRIARPLGRLTDVAETISSTGRLEMDGLPPARGPDETSRLARAFAAMVESLRQSRDAQARLVQDAGHELRTPLTSLRTNVSLLKRPDLPDDKRAGILAALDSELRELTTLTNEVVALAANSTVDEAPVHVDVAAVAEASARRWAKRTGRIVECRSTPAAVCAAATGIQRVFDNLLSNADKFAPSGTPVSLTVDTSGDVVVVTVRDHGPGVDEADIPRLFERFYRSDRDRSVNGSGLGLSIVADVVTRVGGTVTVANHEHGGAVFTVTLPKAR